MSLFRKRLADGERLDLGGFHVRLRVNRRARRISVRVDALSGDAVVTSPTLKHLPDAAAFAKARRDWIAERLAARPATVALKAGDYVSLLGEPLLLHPDGRRPKIVAAGANAPRRLAGCGLGEVDSQLVARALRREALTIFMARAVHHCAALGAAAPSLRLTDARGRWGSCTPPRGGQRGSIRLSWRLAMAPFAVADYVVVHECAHLLEANHGPRFWAHVDRLVGDHRPHRAWLRAHGAALHAFGA